MTVEPSLVPFWRSMTMHGESIVFIADGDEPAQGRLVFPPAAVIAVTSASEEIAYVEDTDYQLDRSAGRLVRLPESRIPEVRRESFAAAGGTLTHAHTVAVTYTHSADLAAWRPTEQAGALPRVVERLRQKQPIALCVTGDSISAGYDGSGCHNLPPRQPAFAALVARALGQRGSSVRLDNFAIAGTTAADAMWDTDRLAAAAPDLVIVGFGMNDACYAEAGEFAANIATLLANLRARRPEVEFVLVSPMLPTPQCSWVVPSRFDEYRRALAGLAGDGVALADVTSLWNRLLARKDPQDLSGNGLNHPNDFGHRLYAQAILDRLA